jgi:hypothetical protein
MHGERLVAYPHRGFVTRTRRARSSRSPRLRPPTADQTEVTVLTLRLAYTRAIRSLWPLASCLFHVAISPHDDSPCNGQSGRFEPACKAVTNSQVTRSDLAHQIVVDLLPQQPWCAAMPLTQRRPRGPEPPRMPGVRGAVVRHAARTWKLRIRWKLARI